MTTLPNHGSCDVNRWIAVLADPGSHSQEERDRAMEALLPAIREVACGAASCFGPRWQQELVDVAPLIMWAKMTQFNPHRGTFRSWCWITLRNAFSDIVRMSARAEAAAVKCGEALIRHKDAPADWQSELRKCNERLIRTREILDRVACRPDEAHEVHLYAVFLMRLRQGMTVLVSKQLGDAVQPRYSLSKFIEDRFLVWQAWEQAERFKPDWPSLLEIWNVLRPTVDTPPHRVEARDVCERVAALTHDRRRLSPSCWNRWVNRAKACARARIDPQEWDDLFAPLLPDQDRPPRGRGPAEGDSP